MAADGVLVAFSLAAAGWVLFWSAFCIGGACSDSPRVTWWAWLALGTALTGAALVLRSVTRRQGRLLLCVPAIIALTGLFTGY